MKASVYLIVLIYFTSGNADQGHHSLWLLATHIIGKTNVPEFSAVLMLDDLKVAHYDSNDRRVIYKKDGCQEEELYPDILNGMERVFIDTFGSMRQRSSILQNHLNFTEIFVHQRLTGCESFDNNEYQVMITAAFNGVYGAALNFNKYEYDYQSGWSELWFSGTLRAQQHKILLEHVYLPICIKTLKYFLKKEKNAVMRKERPRIRVFQKANAKSGDVKMSCLATGFYPRHINLTLLRDGRPVAERQLTGGQLLPNGDGTYQLKKSLEISAGELRERHQYTCTANHLSLDNKLDVTWETEAGHNVSVISLVLVALMVMLSVPAVFAVWRWKRAGCHIQHNYIPAEGTCTTTHSDPETEPRTVNLEPVDVPTNREIEAD